MTTDPIPHRYHHRPNVVGALLLITIGTILLLNNLDIIPWSVWSSLWQYWPVILILIGLQMVFGRSRLGQIVLALLTAGIIIYLLGRLFGAPSPLPFGSI